MLGDISLKFSFFLLIFLLSFQSILTLQCYECKNCTDATCACEQIVEVDPAVSYCILLRENLSNGVNFEIQHIPRNISDQYEYNPYYIAVTETMSYNGTTKTWLKEANTITYACQTDKCNRPDLLKQLPSNGLSLTLSNNWLDDNLIRRTDQKSTSCHECPDEPICGDKPYFVNPNECSVKQCEDLCVLDEVFKSPGKAEYCYQSFCLPSDTQVPEIRINGIYYINDKQFVVKETDVICHGVNCSRWELFKDIKEKLQKDYTGIRPFLPGNHARSIYSTSMIILLMLLLQNIFIH